MYKFSQVAPKTAYDRRDRIIKIVSQANYHDDPYLRNFNLTVILFFIS